LMVMCCLIRWMIEKLILESYEESLEL
jgi:hypothetical protein